jgi:hypothetical protein
MQLDIYCNGSAHMRKSFVLVLLNVDKPTKNIQLLLSLYLILKANTAIARNYIKHKAKKQKTVDFKTVPTFALRFKSLILLAGDHKCTRA